MITETFTGPRRTSLFPKAARPAAPCATYCYHALVLRVNPCPVHAMTRATVCVKSSLSSSSKRESSQFRPSMSRIQCFTHLSAARKFVEHEPHDQASHLSRRNAITKKAIDSRRSVHTTKAMRGKPDNCTSDIPHERSNVRSIRVSIENFIGQNKGDIVVYFYHPYCHASRSSMR